MKIPYQKISRYLVLIFFIISNFGVPILQAKNEKRTLKNQEVIQRSIKGKNNYRFLIKSDNSLEELETIFSEKKTKIKQVADNKYIIRLPIGSSFLSDQTISNIENGILPTTLNDFNIIQPEVVELMTSPQPSPLGGEGVEQLSLGIDIGVGVLDTGIDYTHPDLSDKYNSLLSYDFVNEDSDALDDNGHGTGVAGIIGSEVIGLKVLDATGFGTSYDILEAIQYAKVNNIKVLNMSFGGIGNPENSTVCESITDARNNGIVSIVSAGNSGTDISNMIPAGCNDVIVVGSTDSEGNISSFSNTGSGVIYAPGEDISTPSLNSTYTTGNGTSLSSAFVSGLVVKELALDSTIEYSTLLSNIKNNYNLTLSKVSIPNSGTGTTSSGSTSTGSILLPDPIDYSTYKYYEGTFEYNGQIYGNSLYDDSQDFSGADLSGVTVYTYDEYQTLQQENTGKFQTMSVPTTGLVGSWDLDGDSTDSSGNGNNGAGNAMMWETTAGGNQVGVFNGSSSKINLGNRFSGSTDFTISVWYNTTQTTQGHLYGNNNAQSGRFNLNIGNPGDGDGKLFFFANSGTSYKVQDTQTSNDGKWHLGTIIRSGSTLTLYKDGKQVGQTTGITFSADGTTHQIGMSPYGNLQIDGKEGLIKTYTRALSQSEITSLFHEGQEKILGVDPGIIGQWDLDGNANDTSGDENNGTATNITWVSSSNGDGSQVASFNGASSKIVTNNFLSLTENATFSMATTVKIGEIGKTQFIMGTYQNVTDRFYADIFLIDNGKIQASVTKQNKIASKVISNLTYQLGQTYDIVMTYDGTNIQLYIDGVLDNSGVRTFSNSTYSTLPLNLGYHPYYSNGTLKYNGELSNTKIYNKTLSSTEILNLYNFGSINPTTPNTTEEPQNNLIHATTTDITATYDTTDQACYIDKSNSFVFQSTQDDTQQEKNEGNEGDPVQLSTGKFTYGNTLMSIPGEKIPYELSVNYHNQTYYNGPVGINWDHNYNIYLDEEANGNVMMYNGKLGIFRFIKNGSTFEYNQGLRATLVDTAGVYTVEFDNGDIYTFDSTINRISKLEDRYGNDLTFTYTGNLLTKVTDTLGRDIDYTYFSHNRLQNVTDFNGRKVEFSYYDSGSASGSIYDLQTVTINDGIDATKTIDFEYTTGGDTSSNHNITKLIDSKGQTYVENTYDTGDRVTSQVFGNGTINYSYTLDGNDNITKNTVIDRLGNKTEYDYDVNHNNISTKYYAENGVDSVSYVYEYSTDGYVTKEVRPKGNGYTYSYDSKGNLLEKRFKADITLADSGDDLVTSYTYNTLNQVLTTTHPNGVVETNTINVDGNITSKEIAGLKTHSGATYSSTSNYSYLTGGLVDTITDGEGNITDFNYGSGQVVEIVKGTGALSYTGSFVYNDYGNILSSTDGEGFTKTFDLTDFNLVGTGTTAEGIVTSYEYDVNNNKTKQTIYLTGGLSINTYYTYDILDNLITEVQDTSTGSQLTTNYTYDANEKVTEKQVGNGALYKYNYDAFGNLEEERIVMNPLDSSEDIVTSYTYDDNNNLITKTDPEGNITTYTYDLYDRLIKETNTEGSYSSFGYNKDGSISSKNIYNSGATLLSKTEYLYDNLGNIVNEIKYLDPVNGTGAVSNKVVYDLNGKELEGIDGKGNKTSNFYDNLGRLEYSTDALGNKVSYTYNKRDLVISRVITPNTGTGIVTTTSLYDNDGRKVSETNNLNNTKSFVYNELNQLTSTTDEESNLIEYDFDYLGNITTETKYLSGSLSVTTGYSYDERSNLVSVIDGEGNTTTYEYDGINRNTKVVYVDSKELVYSYDKNSNLLSQTDPNGTLTSNTYNSLNQLASRSITTGTGVIGVTSESYNYDELGRLVSGNDSNLNTLDFEYDSFGRLTKETQNSGTGVSYTYDVNNNLTKIIHPDLRETVYSYDDLNRNASVSFSGETIATYSFTGVVNDSINYGNGKTVSMDYDNLLRLSSLANGVKSYNYDYDKVSNITSDGFKDYSYDDIYRITGVNNSLSGTLLESFNYDDAGNRVSDLDYDYTTNTLNQYTTLSGSTSKSFVYDNNGNIVDNGEYSFEYDYKNRLQKVSTGSTTVSEYTYDVLGRRIEKSIDGEVVSYIYSDKNILEETKTKATGSFKKTYINGIGVDNLIAYLQEESDLSISEQGELDFCTLRVIPYGDDFNTYSWNTITSRCDTLSASGSVIVENIYYFHKNHLGSVVGLTDEAGNTVSEYEYDVFGKATLVSGDDIGNNKLYTSREYDSEIGLYYLRARYYDAEIGRFISRDPIGQIDDVNLYGYVGNNSVMFVDLMGLEKVLIITILGKESSNDGGEITDYSDRESGLVNMVKDINTFNSDRYTTKIYKSDHYSNTVDLATEYIKSQEGEYDKLVIIGHSLGGDNAINITNKLNKSDINVDLLITLDIKAIYENDTIHPNVKKAINYHQTNDSFPRKGEDIEASLFNRTSTVENILLNKYNGDTITHTNMDDKISGKLTNLLKQY